MHNQDIIVIKNILYMVCNILYVSSFVDNVVIVYAFVAHDFSSCYANYSTLLRTNIHLVALEKIFLFQPLSHKVGSESTLKNGVEKYFYFSVLSGHI